MSAFLYASISNMYAPYVDTDNLQSVHCVLRNRYITLYSASRTIDTEQTSSISNTITAIHTREHEHSAECGTPDNFSFFY